MKTANRVALIYGVSFLGAAGVAYLRKRSGQDLVMDTVLHGLVAGTALNVVGYLVLDNGAKVPVLAAAKNNMNRLLSVSDDEELDTDEYDDDEEEEEEDEVEDEEDEEIEAEPTPARTNSAKPSGDMGKTPRKAVEILSRLNTDRLYADLKENGVKIAEVPENPSIIVQEED